jgi:hypothetical protein
MISGLVYEEQVVKDSFGGNWHFRLCSSSCILNDATRVSEFLFWHMVIGHRSYFSAEQHSPRASSIINVIKAARARGRFAGRQQEMVANRANQ